MRAPIDFPKVMFMLSIMGSIFIGGMLVSHYEVFPYTWIKHSVKSLRLLVDEFGMLSGTRPDRHIMKSHYNGSGVVTKNPERMQPGLTLVTSFFEGGLQIRLVSEDGSVVNRWPVNSHQIWDNFDHIQPVSDRPSTPWNSLFNGAIVLPDGSLVFLMRGVVKMDRCGEILWKVPVMAHHSIEFTSKGSFWVPSRHYVAEESLHPPIKTPYEIDTILEISAEGEVLREIAVLDILWQADLVASLFANNRTFRPNTDLDYVHLNDVEEIPDELADRFPLFEKGDLLLSLRELNMVMVFNPNSNKVKWSQIGPWIQQHDPDWQPDGSITVFNNNFDDSSMGSILGGSNILGISPSTGAVKNLYGGRPEQKMYTSVQGDHQILKNGNILITESDSGRLIEVTPNGEIVWEYINRYSENEVLRIPDAVRYEPDYFEVEDWSCD